ncbi:MAG: NADPH-dependent oxidoreductase [Chitinophagaceae bacterium]|nr:NADPH-dependent oxidoreductase [Chitinophagaceae bacterium]
MSYTIISGTNRRDSNTYRIALHYQQVMDKKGIEAKLVTLENVNPLAEDGEFKRIERDILIPTSKFIFISPEYNGSIPGILKLVIDEADWKTAWRDKKAALVGVSTGRAGNLRGMDHLTSILHHMNIHVLPNMLPISQVDRFLNGNGQVTDTGILAAVEKQIDQFIVF